MFKRAFTLTEVLLTMTIVGVVAMMSMPSLLHNYQKKVLSSQLQKAYAEISQAGAMALSDNMVKYIEDTKAFGENTFTSKYIKGKEVGYEDCFSQKYMDDGKEYNFNPENWMSSYSCIQSVAGWGLCFGRSAGAGMNFGVLDVNGKKDPNKMGVDMYRIFFDTNGRLTGYSGELEKVLDNDWEINF